MHVEPLMAIRWIVAGLFTVALVSAAELPADVRHLAGLAASLPPEFQADALLKIVESHGGLEPALKKDLLEQAASLARQSSQAYQKVAAHGIAADSRQAFQASASALKLDRLSLEMRAIRNMLPFDPIGARQLYQQTQKPVPPNGACRELLIPQLDDYYDIGAQVVSRGFTPKEISRQEPVALLLQILASAKAPYEVAPAARMLTSANLATQQFEAGLNAFTARLESISPDNRSFSETALASQQEIGTLADRAFALGIPRGTLARAYRKYLTSNYAAPRCDDSAGARIAGTPHTSAVDWFNQSDLRGDLPLIEMKDLTGKKDPNGKVQLDAFWSTPDSERILTAAQRLRTSPGGVFYSVQERSSTEWNQKLQDFLAQLNDWKQSGDESELDFFNQKATVYQSLIDLCPSGDGRQRMVHAFVDFLKSSNVAASAPVDWFWHAQNMYRRLRQSGDADASKLMSAYRGSGNLMLEVYAQFNQH